MKIKLFLILTIFPSLYIYSQIGVNTEYPKGIFHVDPKADNGNVSIPLNVSDDVIVTFDGDLGIGLLNPSQKLEVKGSSIFRDKVRVDDGTQGAYKTFTSDGKGRGFWAFMETLKKVKINYNLKPGEINVHSDKEDLFLMDNKSTIITYGNLVDVNFSLKSFDSTEGSVSNGFSLKKGEYLFMISSNIASNERGMQSAEYGILRLKAYNSKTNLTTVLFDTYYMLNVNGRYFYVKADTDDKFYITFEPINNEVKDVNGNSFFLSPPYNTKDDKAELLVILLTIDNE